MVKEAVKETTTAKTYKKKSPRYFLSRKRLTKNFNKKLCNNKMSYEECQLAILNHYIEKNEFIQNKEQQERRNIKQMTKLLEAYLQKTNLVCYGGIAINNILPKKVQFYDHTNDNPDYDCYSMNPEQNAKEIADMYVKAGFKNVEAKAGVHYGTIKVYVDFVNMADLTLIDPLLFRSFKKEAIRVRGIYYAPPNVLRMNACIEISSPKGYVARWGKVVRRLSLLDHYFPMKANHSCPPPPMMTPSQLILDTIFDVLVDEDVVFFGGYAQQMYLRYHANKNVSEKMVPDHTYDVLSLDTENTVRRIQKALVEKGVEESTLHKHEPIDELIPAMQEIRIGKQTVACVYEPHSCYNFNTVHVNGHKKKVRIATIDTILAFYLAFYYAGSPGYDPTRTLCMAQTLFEIQKDTKLIHRGILKRFNSSCLGTTPTLADMLEDKFEKKRDNHKSNKLRFFHYIPDQ